MAKKKKAPGFGKYRISHGRYYRKGNTYRAGDTVVLPLDEKPPVPELCNLDGSAIEWDEKAGLVVNASGAVAPQRSGDEVIQAARALANKKNSGELQEMCYGLDLDPNGTKLDMAGRILAAQAGALANDDDDDDDDDGESTQTTEVGGAGEE